MANGEELPSANGVWDAYQAQHEADVLAASKTRVPWVMPLPVGGKSYVPSQAWQNSWNDLSANPVSGYSPNANYGATLGRFNFSHTAPTPESAPQGWGRYPGTGGGRPNAPWVTNPYTPTLPKLGNYGQGGNTGGGGAGVPGGAGGGLTPTNLPLLSATSAGGARMNAWSPQLPPVPQKPITGAVPQPKLPPEGYGKTPVGTGTQQPTFQTWPAPVGNAYKTATPEPAPFGAQINPLTSVYGVNSGRLPPTESTTYTPSPMVTWTDAQNHDNRSQNLDIEARFGPLDTSQGQPLTGESFMQYAQRLGFPAQYLGLANFASNGADQGSWLDTLKKFY